MSLAKKIMTILNVAEKNDAAKAIANFLSNGQAIRREGRSKFNKLYEFNYNFNGSQAQMIMTSVSGHLMNYEFPFNCKNWNDINPAELFDQPVHKICSDNFQPLKKSLEELIRRSDMLIIWTDCDREGENIGMEIVDVCRAVKPNVRVKRAKFSQITKTSTSQAINNLIEIDELASKAVDVRQELDLRIGASFTRLQTLHLRRMFPDIQTNQVISYGSCQFPTLGFVVERFKAIEDFIAEPFWKIILKHRKNENNVEFNWDRTRLFDEDLVKTLLENITDGGSVACVFDISTKPKSKWRPFALDTIELEKLSSRKLGINSKETMQVAEKLYSQGYISYPRTETNIFPKDIDLRPLVEIQCHDDRWREFANKLLTDGITPHNGKKTDQAHPPIHPLKQGTELSDREGRIYELIARHFLACLSKDAHGSETRISLECISQNMGSASWPSVNGQINRCGHGETFNISGLVILARNYLEVYPYDKWSDKELPPYEKGEIFRPTSVAIEQGETSAPQLLTEADLIHLMDKHGIGTDATHAEHIFKVKERNYVGNTGQGDKYLIPGKLGMGLVEGYDLMGFYLSRPNLRAKLEADLEEICRGSKLPRDVLSMHIREYKDIFTGAVNNINKLVEGVGKFLNEPPSSNDSTFISSSSQHGTGTLVNVRACPSCNGFISIRKANNTWILGCSNFPTCKHTIWLPQSVEVAKVALDSATGTPTVCFNAHENTKNHPVHKISLKFNTRMNIIADILPDEDRQYVFCLYCHDEACDILEIKRPKEITIQSTIIPRESMYHTQQPMSRQLKQTSAIAPLMGPSSNSFQQTFNINTNAHQAGNSENVPLCLCGQPTVYRKVLKDGANKGRMFYGCAKMQCNSFTWDESNNQGLPSTSMNSQHGNATSSQISNSPSSCECNMPAKLLKVTKESVNKGREFYTCPTQTCRFFQWADEAPGGDSKKQYVKKKSQPIQSTVRTKKTFTSTENMWPPMANDFNKTGDTKPRAPRRCTRCKNPGHTAKTCSAI